MEASTIDRHITGKQPGITRKAIRALINEMTAESTNGRRLDVGDRMATLRKLVEHGAVISLDKLLPALLQLNGVPYTLDDYRPFESLYRTIMPKSIVYKTGRQVAKTTNLAAHGTLLATSVPNHKTLYVTPLYEQIRRFSNNYVRPFINNSPLKAFWTSTATESSVLQRSFKNGSMMLFSFALMDTDRIRGISAHRLAVDEVQDMDPAHIPIMLECLSAARHLAQVQFTGTSKTLDNTLQAQWMRSSQAEWFIPCLSCNHWNIPAKDYHLEKMIGPLHMHISEKYPGTICYNCRKPISPRYGRWVHRYPDRRWLAAGYHIPQVILPLHYASVEKWSDLLRKQQGWGNTTQAVFWNEVMGEAVDTGQKLLTETDMKNACRLPYNNNMPGPDPKIKEALSKYTHRMLAIDWGGGGETEVSFTVLSLLGFKRNGQIDVLWGKRLLLGCDHLKEAAECIKWFNLFKCHSIAHDYTGAGDVREAVLIQAGLNPQKIFGVRLARTGNQDLMLYHPPTTHNHHAFYTLDKARSLTYTANAIKLGQIAFFQWDFRAQDNPGLISDFLALMENKTETRLAGDVYTIVRNPMLSDDFAQATNIGCSMLWQMHEAWPNFASLAGVKKLTNSQIEAAGTKDWGWESDPMASQFFNMP